MQLMKLLVEEMAVSVKKPAWRHAHVLCMSWTLCEQTELKFTAYGRRMMRIWTRGCAKYNASPLFWVQRNLKLYACYGESLPCVYRMCTIIRRPILGIMYVQRTNPIGVWWMYSLRWAPYVMYEGPVIRKTQHAHRIIGTVSAKIAPRLKCYKNASRLNRYNCPTDNAIDFLFSTLHSAMV